MNFSKPQPSEGNEMGLLDLMTQENIGTVAELILSQRHLTDRQINDLLDLQCGTAAS